MISRRNIIFCFFPLLCGEHTTAQTRLNFTIETLWNGTLIVNDRLVRLTLSSTDDKNDLLIKIDAPFFDNPAPSSPPGPFSELWNYEVVELFFLALSTTRYTELEFSPHGHHLVILLIGRGSRVKQLLQLPTYRVERQSSDRWTGQVYVPPAYFPAHVNRFNAYAIHGQRENRTYEALYPEPPESDRPDFHRLELFHPLDFELLLNVDEKDGDSWPNHASLSASFTSFLIEVFFLASLLMNYKMA